MEFLKKNNPQENNPQDSRPRISYLEYKKRGLEITDFFKKNKIFDIRAESGHPFELSQEAQYLIMDRILNDGLTVDHFHEVANHIQSSEEYKGLDFANQKKLIRESVKGFIYEYGDINEALKSYNEQLDKIESIGDRKSIFNPKKGDKGIYRKRLEKNLIPTPEFRDSKVDAVSYSSGGITINKKIMRIKKRDKKRIRKGKSPLVLDGRDTRKKLKRRRAWRTVKTILAGGAGAYAGGKMAGTPGAIVGGLSGFLIAQSLKKKAQRKCSSVSSNKDILCRIAKNLPKLS